MTTPEEPRHQKKSIFEQIHSGTITQLGFFFRSGEDNGFYIVQCYDTVEGVGCEDRTPSCSAILGGMAWSCVGKSFGWPWR